MAEGPDLEPLKIKTCCERVKFHATSFVSWQ
jgi:hypothetical protein